MHGSSSKTLRVNFVSLEASLSILSLSHFLAIPRGLELPKIRSTFGLKLYKKKVGVNYASDIIIL